MNDPIRPEEFKEWKDHPVTQALHQHLKALVDQSKDFWSRGDYTSPNMSSDVLAQVNVHNAALMIAYQYVMEMDFETLTGVEEKQEGKHE